MYKFQLEASQTMLTSSPPLVMSKKLRAYYPSNFNGNKIVNAATGKVYPHCVGTKNEELYFRVIDASGRVDSTGKFLEVNCTNPNPNKLFYENKEEYLNHRPPMEV